MQSGCSPRFIERQPPDCGERESLASLQPPPPFGRAKEYANEDHPTIVFDSFINAVERLERLLDRETAMLIEHRLIALDDFNHKKRHGLLELSRAMDAMRGLDRGGHSLDPKAPLARLRVKLQKNLVILQMHLDAVGAITEIIARAIQEHESDGTYTPALGGQGKPR